MLIQPLLQITVLGRKHETHSLRVPIYVYEDTLHRLYEREQR
jgi:hypothetical protein